MNKKIVGGLTIMVTSFALGFTSDVMITAQSTETITPQDDISTPKNEIPFIVKSTTNLQVVSEERYTYNDVVSLLDSATKAYDTACNATTGDLTLKKKRFEDLLIKLDAEKAKLPAREVGAKASASI